jgi:transposase-like protein
MATDTGSLVDALQHQDLAVGDRLTVSLEFADTEGYLHPVELVNKPAWMTEEMIFPIFQGYLERFQKSGASSYKSSSQDGDYKFSFEVKEQLATLTIIKEEEDEPSIAPKRGGDGRRKYDEDAREKILEALQSGMTTKDAAEKFEVSTATINLWKKAAGLSSGKRGRKPGSKNRKPGFDPVAYVAQNVETASTLAAAEKALKAARAKGHPESITLNGVVYVPMKKGDDPTDKRTDRKAERADAKGKANMLKSIARLEQEIASLRGLLG